MLGMLSSRDEVQASFPALNESRNPSWKLYE